MIQAVAARFVAGVADAADHVGVVLRRVAGPEERGLDVVLFQEFQQPRRAVFHAFVKGREGADIGLHVEPENNVEGVVPDVG